MAALSLIKCKRICQYLAFLDKDKIANFNFFFSVLLKSSYSAICTQFHELHSSLVSNDINPIDNSNISLSRSSMVNGSKPFTLSNTLRA